MSAPVDAIHDEEALGRAYDARLFARLWPYVRPYGGLIALSIALVGPLFLIELAEDARPTEVPQITSGSIPSRSKPLMMPMCDQPLDAPDPSASPIFWRVITQVVSTIGWARIHRLSIV